MKYVYAFREGNRDQKYLLGGKGANLAEMTSMGLPVPPGFTITTDACKAYMAAGNTIPDGLMTELRAGDASLPQWHSAAVRDVIPRLVSADLPGSRRPAYARQRDP